MHEEEGTNSLPDIYRNSMVEEEEESVLIPDVWLPSDERRKQEEEEKKVVSDPDSVMAEPEIPPGYSIYTPEEFESQVSKRVEEIRGQLWKEAYQEAAEEKGGEIHACIQQVQDALRQLRENHRKFLEEYRDHLASLAIDVAEKLILHKIDKDDLFLADLVTKTVGSMKNAEWITVGVSDQLADLVDFLRKEFKNPDYGNVEVTARYYPTDTCLLETDEGVLDASISEQIRNLRQEFDAIEG